MRNLNDTLNEITKAFKQLNEYLFGNALPEPVLVIQSRKAGARNAMGWFTLGKNWTDRETGKSYHEITVCSETLNKPMVTVLEVLVHEMVHLENKIKGIVDCSAGQYHNKKFKEAAERALLICKASRKYGYGLTEPSEKLLKLFDVLSIDESAFNLASTDNSVEERKKYIMFTYVCDGCGIKFKTKANLAPNTQCGNCGGLINKYKIEEGETDE